MRILFFGGLIAAVVFLSACSDQDFNDALGGVIGGEPSEAEISAGLKQALDVGIQRGATELAERGYADSPYAIGLPAQAQTVIDRLKGVPGFREIESVLKQRLNQAASAAADQAAPIFSQAIQEMTIADARSILLGDDDAATTFLRKNTYSELYATYQPVIIDSLNRYDAQEYWADIVARYNQIPLVEKANPDLADFVTTEALDGLFAKLADEEQSIREDLSARSTDLLRRVFALQDPAEAGFE